MGTLFQLATCHQHVAKTASAWAEFLEVAAEAKASGQSAREKVARERAAALAPKLAHMTIAVDASRAAPGLRVLRDGTEVGRGQWNSSIPVDPGSHRVEATAPGKQPWSTTIAVAEAASASVREPALADEPAPAAAAIAPRPIVAIQSREPATLAPTDPPLEDVRSGHGQRVAGGITLGVGVAGVGLGTAFGLMSKRAHDDADPHCRVVDRCDATGVSLRDDARRDGTIATVGFGVGAAAIVTGAVLWLTAPSRSTALAVAPTPEGALVRGRF
jgi:hypothetical protein